MICWLFRMFFDQQIIIKSKEHQDSWHTIGWGHLFMNIFAVEVLAVPAAPTMSEDLVFRFRFLDRQQVGKQISISLNLYYGRYCWSTSLVNLFFCTFKSSNKIAPFWDIAKLVNLRTLRVHVQGACNWVVSWSAPAWRWPQWGSPPGRNRWLESTRPGAKQILRSSVLMNFCCFLSFFWCFFWCFFDVLFFLMFLVEF